jgi:acetate kinase
VNVLVLNAGSSSLKFQVIALEDTGDGARRLARGVVERIGEGARAWATAEGAPGGDTPTAAPARVEARDHGAALAWVRDRLFGDPALVAEIRSPADIQAVGHRVVHGGDRFSTAVRITSEVLEAIEACAGLAPLHNPANLQGIRAALNILGTKIPQVAVFDTAFHTAIPERAHVYGLPLELARRHRIRRYGFHGISHRSAAARASRLLDIPLPAFDAVLLHLGNGASACAVKGGVSVDTSMGFTPLEGLLMGTRSGDLDPSVVGYLMRREGLSPDGVDELLNERSGLLGLSGRSADMRDLLEAEDRDPRARLAVDVFCYRAAKYVGAYAAALRGPRALVFTGGIGENAPVVRSRICEGLDALGIRLDAARNDALAGGREGEIGAAGMPVRVGVVPADEEILIARDTRDVATGGGQVAAVP